MFYEFFTEPSAGSPKSFVAGERSEDRKAGVDLACFFAGRFLSSRDRDRPRVFLGATFTTRSKEQIGTTKSLSADDDELAKATEVQI